MAERIISNPFYYGDMLVKGKIKKGNHKPIVNKKLWDDCQRIRGIRAAGQGITDKALVKKPLMNLLQCDVCKSKVTGEVKRKKTGKHNTHTITVQIQNALKEESIREKKNYLNS